MSDQKALNLSEIDPPIWRVMSGQVAYGPYTLGQLQRLIQDNQLTPTSKVSNGDGSPFLPAAQHTAILRLFDARPDLWPQDDEPDLTPEPARKRYLLIFYGDDDSRDNLMDALNSVGEFAELVFGTFVIKSDLAIADMQRHIGGICASDDCFVLVEANSGRLAWFGITDDISEHVRELWKASS